MSTLRVNNLQIGQSGTAAQNFTLYQPTTPDGTLRLAVGNSGATTGDVLSVSNTGLSVTGTLSATGNVTLSGGTANGVLYLNGSKVATSGSALTFNGTVLSNAQSSASSGLLLSLQNTSTGSYIEFAMPGVANVRFGAPNADAFVWQTFGSGTYPEQMRLTSTGLGIGLGGSSPYVKLQVTGTIKVATGNAQGILSLGDGNGATTNVGLWRGAANAPTTDGNFLNLGGYDGIVFAVGAAAIGSQTERMRLDSSGNLGLGVTPSAWGGFGSLDGRNDFTWSGYDASLGANYYYNGGYKYKSSSVGASKYEPYNGAHKWYIAPSGTANTAITFTQAMTLDASGNLGVGNTSMSSFYSGGRQLVVGSGSGEQGITIYSGNTTGYLLFAKGTTGSDAYAGQVRYDHGNSLLSIVNVKSGALVLSTNDTERARITSGGDLLVGTNNSASNAGNGCKLKNDGGLYVVGTAGDTYNFYNSTAAAYRFYVTNAGVINATSTTITAISDQRLKENIQDIDVGLNAVMALKPRKFDWKAGKGKDKKGDRGWIAQEFEQVFPDMITTWKDEPPEGEEPYKAVNADLIPVLVKAIQEQQAIITALTARIAALEGTQP